MKKKLLALSLSFAVLAGAMTGCGATAKNVSWKVTCPWAASGVASMVSQKAAAKSADYSETITLVAEAVPGDAATVNTWIADTEADDPELIFVGEGLLSITSILDPDKLQFSYEDFTYVENLYSSVFVLSANAELGLGGIPDLQSYVEAASADGAEITVAVNGATGSEAFLAAALFGSMGAGDVLKLTPYESAAEAAQAVARGETDFAVSHQSQILETCQQGGVTVVCAFDEAAIGEGPFAGVEGVGEYGYPYFRNRCFIMAPAGADADSVAELKALYDSILADDEVVEWLQDTMYLEVDTMSQEEVEAHIENVRQLVNEYMDIVVG